MLKMKNAALTMAVMLALAACGGSSSDGPAPGTNNPPAQGAGLGTGPAPAPDPAPGTNPDPAPVADASFNGNMVLAANQVLFNGIAIDYTTFNTTGAFGFARGDSAPLQSFGMRVYQEAMMGQSENVRIAVELDDVASDVLIQVLLDQATLSISDTGALSVTVPPTAQAHVVVRNAAGNSTSASAGGLAANVVSFVDIPDDPTSRGLVINIDALMTAAIAAAPEANRPALLAARDVEGEFAMRAGMTGVTLLSNTGTALTLAAPITVGNQPAVSTGTGLTGVLRIGTAS